MSLPSVTVVVVPRERFSNTQSSLESIYRNTTYPFELIYVDANSPAPVRQYLQRAAADRGFRLIRTERFLSPNQARNIGAREVRTKYVVFIDNDVEVESGWLNALVACAEETGAWAVSPVYLEGDRTQRVIHMAGGRAEFVEQDGLRAFDEEHLFNARRFEDVAPMLERAPTGFFEFHTVLLPMTVVDTIGPFDENLPSSNEHLDASLLIRQAGGKIYLVPSAQVTYTLGLLDDYDLEYATLRWSDEWNRRSTTRFVEKWNIDRRSPWVQQSIDWCNNHRAHLGRMRRSVYTVLKRQASRNVMTRRLYAALSEARAH